MEVRANSRTILHPVGGAMHLATGQLPTSGPVFTSHSGRVFEPSAIGGFTKALHLASPCLRQAIAVHAPIFPSATHAQLLQPSCQELHPAGHTLVGCGEWREEGEGRGGY